MEAFGANCELLVEYIYSSSEKKELVFEFETETHLPKRGP